jgi:hypothetical protein
MDDYQNMQKPLVVLIPIKKKLKTMPCISDH